jgi:hypothetical protein
VEIRTIYSIKQKSSARKNKCRNNTQEQIFLSGTPGLCANAVKPFWLNQQIPSALSPLLPPAQQVTTLKIMKEMTRKTQNNTLAAY